MPQLLRDRVALVWTTLVGATVAAWWIGAEGAVPSPRAAGVCVLLIAFVKVRLVGLHFMDLRAAPVALRAVFETWCLAAGGVTVALSLLA